ncbi:MAG: ATPase, T2SS/T4P/T4SS family, partial [Candidatus Peregrinibacteria bacterium]|nr:ATPase, T2SS/T4P/T4SS family [Candidatus Peregrinibacteria bacterium]
MDNIKIKKILLAESYVSQEDMQKAETFAKKNKTSVVEYFLSKEILTESLLGQAVAESYGVAFADLEKHAPSVEQVLKIPEHLARRYKAVLVAEREKEVLIATVNPTREGLVKDLQEVFKKKIIIAYASPEAIKKAFIHYQKPLETQFASIVKKSEKIAPEILSAIFEDAILHTASDIHFEPQGDRVLIRFRVDGVLHEAGHIENDHYENVLNRIKVQALLRIDEHFAAQDGALRYTMSNNEAVVDMRVSILPTINGEKIVIRILSQYVRSLSLSEIGLTPENEALFRKSAKSPFGMILITGPTGSGKTTSLYALLKILHRPEVNITTIEDPVEYKIKGINQIQVNLQTDLTFEKGLKSIVRQDPDIILVGEVRGEETAEIAVNAALTGHLLFSTFHAN